MFLKTSKSLEEDLLERCMVSGDFLLRSGVVSSEKFDFERITQSTYWRDKWLLRRTEKALGDLIMDKLSKTDVVLTVANGANPLAAGVARHVSCGQPDRTEKVLGYETRKLEDGNFRVNQGNVYVYGLNVTVVDDVYTQGTNIGLVADTVERFGGKVIGAAVILNRNEHGISVVTRGENASDIPVYSMIQHPIATYSVED